MKAAPLSKPLHKPQTLARTVEVRKGLKRAISFHKEVCRVLRQCFLRVQEQAKLNRRSATYEYVDANHLGEYVAKDAARHLGREGLRVRVSPRYVPDPDDDYLSPKTGTWHYRISFSW